MGSALKQELLETKLCKNLDLHEVDLLLNYAKIVVFNPGHRLLEQGKANQGIYIILKGTARVTAKVVGIGVIDLVTLGAGNIVGGVTLLGNAIGTTSITAEEQTKCLYIPKAYFEMLFLFSPITKYKIDSMLMEEIVSRFKNIYNKITETMKHSAMSSRSILNSVFNSLNYPKKINLSESGILHEQLKSHDFFLPLSDEDFLFILQYTDMYDAIRYCNLIKEGEKSGDCYLILRGAVQSSIQVDGKIAKLSVHSPHSIFSGMSFVENLENLINFTTCERTVYLKITSKNLEELKEKKPELWFYLYDAVCRSLAGLTQAANRLDIRLNSEIYNR